ncbi:matrix protein mmp37 [Cystoisospora suis]|uniref:Phosphatidate cytidylyltransferase, mitochondrial n=1 Tax=Cystoisospora suis TaxID=483139 RepID=A0A2C6KK21_9APIC|nr:matrix protein mmp37 [Cystoisospora suis]
MEQQPFSPVVRYGDSSFPSFPWDAFPPQAQWVIAYGSAFFSQKSPLTPCSSSSSLGHPPTSSPPHSKLESTTLAPSPTESFNVTGHRKPLAPPGACTSSSSDNSTASPFSLFTSCSSLPVASAVLPPAVANSASLSLCRDYLVLVPRQSIEAFHEVNLRMHSNHYAWPFRLLGPSATSAFQRLGRGVEVFYNPLVRLHEGGEVVKYGVTSIEDFCTELQEWSSLFFSGRLHKPVHILSRHNKLPVTQAPFYEAIQLNRLNALRTAVLLQEKPVFSFRQLLYAICGLSYKGDIRMAFVENPRKLSNLVSGQTTDLFSIYSPLLSRIPELRLIHTPSGGVLPGQGPWNTLDSPVPPSPLASRYGGGCRAPAPRSDCASISHPPPATLHSKTPSRLSERVRTKSRNDGPLGDGRWAASDWREEILNDRLLVEIQGCEQNDLKRWRAFRRSLCDKLPPRIRELARRQSRMHGYNGSPSAADVSAALISVVRRSSAISACKNMATAGLFRTVIYGLQKLSKR